MAPQLAHSHAREEGIPGTVNLAVAEGDTSKLGQALYPPPANDPNDPLQWPRWRKIMILIVIILYCFFSNTACLGPSVYISLFAEEFGIDPNTASGLVSYPTLCYGGGTILLIPLYIKFGRRPIMLGTVALYFIGLIGCAVSNSYGTLMLCRVIHTFTSGVCEALPVALVNDIFFLHERGTMLGFYTVALCFGATGPLYAGYMLAGGIGWRLFFWVEAAFAGLILILTFFFVEETQYRRKFHRAPAHDDQNTAGRSSDWDSPVGDGKVYSQDEVEEKGISSDHIEVETLVPPRRTYLQQLKPWSGINHHESFWKPIWTFWSYFFVAPIFWVMASYGIYIGLGALVFNYTFPILIVAPPYEWPQTSSGLGSLASLIGYALAVPFTSSSDRLAARLTKKNGHIREAEMRLGVLFPAMVIAPAGLVVYGVTAQNQLHWVGYFAGIAMVSWGAYFYFTFTLAYAVDSYQSNTSEMLIAMCVGKSSISFGFGQSVLQWVQESGYVVIISGIFVAVTLINNLAVFPFMIWGKRMRTFYAKDHWLNRMHKKEKAMSGG